jgi:ribosomal-protein-serine acetyltransferase
VVLEQMSENENLAYPELEVDEQIKLKILQPEHAERVYELVDKNRDYLGRWFIWVDKTKSAEVSQQFIEEQLEKRLRGREYTYGVVYEGLVVGVADLRIKGDKAPEIGYWIDEDYSGRGITTKVANGLIEFAKSELGVERFALRIDPRNKASQRVAEKLGFAIDGDVYDEPTGRTLDMWYREP